MPMTTTLTLIIFNVGSTGIPLFALPNIDESILHAVEKFCARKNTQVIFTRKNVRRASKNLFIVFDRMNAGAREAVVTGIGIGTGSISPTFFGLNNLSIHK